MRKVLGSFLVFLIFVVVLCTSVSAEMPEVGDEALVALGQEQNGKNFIEKIISWFRLNVLADSSKKDLGAKELRGSKEIVDTKPSFLIPQRNVDVGLDNSNMVPEKSAIPLDESQMVDSVGHSLEDSLDASIGTNSLQDPSSQGADLLVSIEDGGDGSLVYVYQSGAVRREYPNRVVIEKAGKPKITAFESGAITREYDDGSVVLEARVKKGGTLDAAQGANKIGVVIASKQTRASIDDVDRDIGEGDLGLITGDALESTGTKYVYDLGDLSSGAPIFSIVFLIVVVLCYMYVVRVDSNDR